MSSEALKERAYWEGVCPLFYSRRLPEDKNMAFLSLYDPDPSRPPLGLLSQYSANAFEIGTWSDQPRPMVSYIVCLQASRINHSCNPNAYLDLNTNINRITVHAVVDIHSGQEITVSYCLPYYSREIRLRDLAHHDFYCHCIVCQPTTMLGRLKEARRYLMQQTWLTLHNENEDETWDDCQEPLNGTFKMIDLLTMENMNVGALSVLYQRAARLSMGLGNCKRALECANKKLKIEMQRLGSDSLLTQETERYIRALKSPPAIDPQLG